MLTRHRPGLQIARAAILLAKCDGIPLVAKEYAERKFGADSATARLLRDLERKAVVSAANTNEPNWGGSVAEEVFGEFFDAVAERSIVGRLGALPAPLNSTVSGLSTAFGAGWIGQGAAIPLARGVFSKDSLSPLKVGTIVALTLETLRLSNTEVEEIVRRRLIAAAAEAIDRSFIDPDNAGSANVEPASILSAPMPTTSTGNLNGDLEALVDDFAGDHARAAFVISPKRAAKSHGTDHPDIGLGGGSLIGAPAIVSRSCPDDVIALLDADGIAVAMAPPDIDVSTEADLLMSDDPAGDGSAALVSGWQSDLVSIRLIQRANWAAVRTGAAAYVDGVSY